MLENLQFDEIILATGIIPRKPPIPGIDHEKVLEYRDVISGKQIPGNSVAIIGAGGIGFDTAEMLSHTGSAHPQTKESFFREWGIDLNGNERGGLMKPVPDVSPREIYLMQRTPEKPGKRLGKSTGWIHRLQLKNRKVNMLGGVTYNQIDDRGIQITENNQTRVLPVDHIILCAGQESNRILYEQIKEKGWSIHLIGGANKAGELDAKRAIQEGSELAAAI